MSRFFAILIVLYIVDGLKGDLIICFNVLTLPCKDHVNIHVSYTDDIIIILLKFIFTGLHGYEIKPGLSTNKQRHRLLLLKKGIHVAPTHP